MEYYISPNGIDSNPGTIASPLKTIDNGLNKAVAGDRVILREGTYRNRGGWFPSEKATTTNPITVEAYPGETVNLSAFGDLTDWEPFDLTDGKAIYRAPMPFSMCGEGSAIAGEDFLIYNGTVLNEAQWPAANINKYPQASGGWAVVEDGRWLSDADAERADVTAEIQDEDLLTFPANSLVGSYITILLGARWTLLSGKVTANQGNKLTFATKSPGGSSFYYPDDRSLYFLFGKKEFLSYPGSWWRDPVSSIVYAWLPDSSNPANSTLEAKQTDKLIDYWSRSYYHHRNLNFLAATVNGVNALGLVFEGCTFKWYSHRLYHQTSWAWVGPAFYHNTNGLTLRDCDFMDTCAGVVAPDGNSDLIIENCTVINSGGLAISGANSRIAQNTIWNCPYGPAKISNNITGLRFYNNDIGYGGATFFDGAMLIVARTAAGSDAEVYNNYLHDGYGTLDGTREFYGTAGLYFEDNTAEIKLHHNIVSRVTSPGLNICGDLQNISFVNNVFDNPQGVAWWTNKRYHGCKFINNYAVKFHSNTAAHPDMECKMNAFKEIAVPNNITTPDPKFNPDYSLQSDSALKGAGMAFSGVTSTNPPDIGAWEGGRSLVGAVLRKKDLVQIQATVTAITSSMKVTLSNLPLGRKPGADFSLRVGETAASRWGDREFLIEDFASTGTPQKILAKINLSDDWFEIGTASAVTTPIIAEVSPSSGATGDSINIIGYSFAPGATVLFGDRVIPAENIDSGSITFVVP